MYQNGKNKTEHQGRTESELKNNKRQEETLVDTILAEMSQPIEVIIIPPNYSQ